MASDLIYGFDDALDEVHKAITAMQVDVEECTEQARVALRCGDEDHAIRILHTLHARAIDSDEEFLPGPEAAA